MKEIELANHGVLIVNWNPDLRGFVAQVLGPGTTSMCMDDLCYISPHTRRDCQDDQDLIVHEFGLHGELPTLDALERGLGEYATALTPSIREALELERTESPS